MITTCCLHVPTRGDGCDHCVLQTWTNKKSKKKSYSSFRDNSVPVSRVHQREIFGLSFKFLLGLGLEGLPKALCVQRWGSGR